MSTAREAAILFGEALLEEATKIHDENDPTDCPVLYDASSVLMDSCQNALARLRAPVQPAPAAQEAQAGAVPPLPETATWWKQWPNGAHEAMEPTTGNHTHRHLEGFQPLVPRDACERIHSAALALAEENARLKESARLIDQKLAVEQDAEDGSISDAIDRAEFAIEWAQGDARKFKARAEAAERDAAEQAKLAEQRLAERNATQEELEAAEAKLAQAGEPAPEAAAVAVAKIVGFVGDGELFGKVEWTPYQADKLGRVLKLGDVLYARVDAKEKGND